MSISMTHDYNLFKKFFLNRTIKESNLATIKSSIVKNNLLNANPIIVTHSYEVLDGQHRLQCAQDLNFAIYYVRLPEMSLETLIQVLINLNNALRKWSNYEFLELYCKMNNPDYIRFKDFRERFGLDLNIAVAITEKRSKRKGIKDKFKNGEFKFDRETELHNLISQVREFLELAMAMQIINTKDEFRRMLSKAFIDAYSKLLAKYEDFSQSKMLDQLKKYGIANLPTGVSMMHYFNQLDNLYTCKRQLEKKAA